MTTTLGDLIETTRDALTGYGSSKDAVAATTAPVAVSATSFTVDDVTAAGGVGRGLAEIDLELVRVKAVDANTGTVTLYPFGRGYRGTTAAEHDADVEVRFNPGFPAASVAREVNGVLTEAYPSLYVVRSWEAAVPADRGGIDLPADTEGVISVQVADPHRTGQWLPVDRWRVDWGGGARVLRLPGHTPGLGVRVEYAARPGLFDLDGAMSQDFATVTGLDERVADLVRLGVACRMAPFLDVAKLPFLAASARDMGEAKAPGQAASLTRLLNGLYQQRLEQEARVLAKEYPIRLHRVR